MSKSKKDFIECLTNFMGDSEGLTQEEIASELEEMGIDTAKLATAVEKLVKKYSPKPATGADGSGGG